ncbi:hypothetical protein LPJ77_002803 [Coemansia sp. RSA 2523]|nr:hypothetical protein LPJ54_002359 [Coemansia sp. RSA 1824]KAJ1807767.1 hypothetical protein LPJ77_002803 [Coemansia sp. RSA 2523]KAJ2143283.1 hypothetical protein IW142_003810 [Coemansia sp. RSA 564]KAJ2151370.1 hypothetical protein J3F82_003393 [Coemansia sp. RSA 637]KAJ2166027.1 hypothetical protein GGH15_003008 [Coemansia sp. RSA 562]KAJ2182996.1 hypothetical protein GGF45_000403 [Coemansia sp. RSA 551]KAJ2190582.1 hypothetical protein EV181_000935 [Coemansia sp. RSA 532]KAJ2197090.1 h
MPKKFTGTNTKVAAANDRKALVKAEKDAKTRKAKEDKDAKDWQVGAEKTGKKDEQAAKRLEKLARKAEADKLLAAENKVNAASKPSRPVAKLAPTVARGAEKKAAAKAQEQAVAEEQNRPVQQFQARNIDDALSLMEAVNESVPEAGQSASSAKKNALIDRHPERRFKAALEAFKDANYDLVKEENPGLRKQQIEDLLFKMFKKAPENPFNQVHAAHNATQDTISQMVESERQKLESRLEI